jgi:hypothetical protein
MDIDGLEITSQINSSVHANKMIINANYISSCIVKGYVRNMQLRVSYKHIETIH